MLRLILSILAFILSLLNLIQAPIFILWLVAILVGEYPVYWMACSLLLILTGFITQKFKIAGTLIGLAAFLLFSLPVIETVIIGNDITKAFTSEFPAGKDQFFRKNFSLSFPKLIGLEKGPVISYQRLDISTEEGPRFTFDFYKGSGKSKNPCVIVIHGGSWKGGDSQQLPELNSMLAEKGYAVVSINYHLAPEYKSPVPIGDVFELLRYLKVHSQKFQIDTSNFILLGRSAGGQIALQAAYTLHDKNIRGVIDFYGPADMVWGYSNPSNPLVLDSRKVMEDYLGGTFHQVPENYINSSPIEFVKSDSPPTLILHGENDVMVAFEHSRRLNIKLKKFGVKHYLLSLPWATHGFDYNLNGPGGQLSTYLTEEFIKSVIHK